MSEEDNIPHILHRVGNVLNLQYIPRNMHSVFALLCFVVVIHWLIFPYPSGLLHWHCGHLTIAPVPAKQPWWIWINTSCEFIMKDCITTTKQSTTKPCAYFLGYTVVVMCFSKCNEYFNRRWCQGVSMRITHTLTISPFVAIRPNSHKLWSSVNRGNMCIFCQGWGRLSDSYLIFFPSKSFYI